MKRLTTADIVISSLIVVLIAATLAPALGRAQRSGADSKCQSNLRRWAEAMSAYTSDNNSCYPTNRANGTVLMAYIPLSQPNPLPGQTEPPRFQYGRNWVESLYPYVQKSAAKTDQDWKSFRRCPSAKDYHYPASTGDMHWAMSYVFNGTLIEQPAAIMRDAHKLMMVRELGRLTVSTLRPSNTLNSPVGNPNIKPQDPFLTNRDYSIGDTSAECQLHGNGSYVLFADGHVDHFTLDYFPETAQISAAMCYDIVTGQWWNFGPSSGATAPLMKSIAITP